MTVSLSATTDPFPAAVHLDVRSAFWATVAIVGALSALIGVVSGTATELVAPARPILKRRSTRPWLVAMTSAAVGLSIALAIDAFDHGAPVVVVSPRLLASAACGILMLRVAFAATALVMRTLAFSRLPRYIRELPRFVFPPLPDAQRRPGVDAELPRDLRRTARLTGLLYGTLRLAATFSALVTTQLAVQADISVGTVQLVAGLAGLGSAAAIIARLARKLGAKLPPHWHVGTCFVGLGLALCLLGAAPSLWTLAAALTCARAVLPLSLLVRDDLARHFHPREGAFIGICETWNLMFRACGGVAFAAALFLPVDVRLPTIALGFCVVAAGAILWPFLARMSGNPVVSERPTAVRLRRSHTLWTNTGATVGIYAALQLFWAEVQPQAKQLGFGDRGAALLAAVFGLSSLAGLRSVRRHGELSDHDAKRSATEASRKLLGAACIGLLSLWVGSKWAAIALLLSYSGLLELGGHSTASAVNTGLANLDPRGVLVSGLARGGAEASAGLIARAFEWTGAVWSIFGFALLTWRAASLLQEDPTGDEVETDTNGLVWLAVAKPESPSGKVKALLAIEARARAVLERPWQMCRRDTLRADGLIGIDQPGAKRKPLFRVRFDWWLTHRRPWRSHGWLYPGARIGLTLDGVEVAMIVWRSFTIGTWTRDGDAVGLRSKSLLRNPIRVTRYRHGP